jgi:hypothetical protein
MLIAEKDGNFDKAVTTARCIERNREPRADMIALFDEGNAADSYWMGNADNPFLSVMFLLQRAGHSVCGLQYSTAEKLLVAALEELRARMAEHRRAV